MMRSSARFFALCAVACAAAACTKSDVVDTPTQVTVRVSTSDSALLQAMTELRVSASLRESEGTWRASVTNVFPAAKLKWPVDVPVFPRNPGDASKQFEVVVEALQDARVLAQARAVTTFAPNRHVLLGMPLFLCPGHEPGFVCASDCRGSDCTVCTEAGTCVQVSQVDADSLPDLRPPGGELDASMSAVTPEPDATRPLDGMAAFDGMLGVDDAGLDPGDAQWPEAGSAAGPIVELCRGSEGQAVCSSLGELLVCNLDGTLSSRQMCDSPRHCQEGLAAKACAGCIPGEFECTGASLMVCDSQGKGFGLLEDCGTAALCNKLLGECTSAVCEANQTACLDDNTLATCNADGTMLASQRSCGSGLCDRTNRECDVCQVGQKLCDQDSTATCNAQGQGYDKVACPAQRRKCVGAGQCVECAAASDCGDPGTCKERVCTSPGGTCAPRNQPDHSPCTNLGQAGVCSAGSCIGCIGDSDCQSRAPLTACNTASHQCVAPARCGDGVPQLEAGEECDDGNSVNEDSCTAGCKNARCGDGFVRNVGISTQLEQCDPLAPGWSTRTCGSDCRRSIYVSNRSGSCPAGTTAPLWGVCTASCNVDSDCPLVPNTNAPFCFPSVKICAIYCTSDSQCPSGLRCNNQGGSATAECNGII